MIEGKIIFLSSSESKDTKLLPTIRNAAVVVVDGIVTKNIRGHTGADLLGLTTLQARIASVTRDMTIQLVPYKTDEPTAVAWPQGQAWTEGQLVDEWQAESCLVRVEFHCDTSLWAVSDPLTVWRHHRRILCDVIPQEATRVRQALDRIMTIIAHLPGFVHQVEMAISEVDRMTEDAWTQYQITHEQSTKKEKDQ